MNRTASRERPFSIENPRSLSPLLLTCEHAGRRLPFSRKLAARHRALLNTHWGWDIGAWELTVDLARRLDATAVGGRWSRLLIDLNRRAADPTLVRRRAGRLLVPWNADLDAAETERRMLAYHVPYHQEVDRLILRRTVRGVRPLLLAVHSFTPRLDGRSRPFQIGILYERHGALARRVGRLLRASGLSVRYNQPYSGMKGMMYSVDRHASHHGLPCLELEVNQGLFARPGTVARLGPAIARAIRAILPVSRR